MKTGVKVLIGVGIVVLILAIMLIGSYNGFVTSKQNVDAKWSEVNSQYQRQADLIPNLVSVVASAVKVETNFTLAVTEARSRWQNAKPGIEKDSAGVQMSDSLANFVNAMAVSESYPTLQANRQYVALTDELAGSQNRITTARKAYIDSVQQYNTGIKTFPSNILAGMFGFSEVEYYKAENGTTTPSLGNATLP